MKSRLLFIDDEESILFAMQHYFSTMEYVVDTAKSIGEAKDLLHQNQYAVVVVDLKFHPLDSSEGLDLARWIKAKWKSTKIVVFTSYRNPDIERAASAYRVDRFLYKPQPLVELGRVIKSLIDGKAGDFRSLGYS